MIATAEATYTTKLIEPAPPAFEVPRDPEAGGPPEARGPARDEGRPGGRRRPRVGPARAQGHAKVGGIGPGDDDG